jgi:hypothetical protein
MAFGFGGFRLLSRISHRELKKKQPPQVAASLFFPDSIFKEPNNFRRESAPSRRDAPESCTGSAKQSRVGTAKTEDWIARRFASRNDAKSIVVVLARSAETPRRDDRATRGVFRTWP